MDFFTVISTQFIAGLKMFNMKPKRILFIFISFVFFQCAKPVEEINQAYIGTWYAIDEKGKDITLVVTSTTSSSESEYTTYNGSKYETTKGPAKIVGEEEKLKIGFKSFVIDQKPAIESIVLQGDTASTDVWRMTLDGIQFTQY